MLQVPEIPVVAVGLTAVAGDGLVAVTWEREAVDGMNLTVSRYDVGNGASTGYPLSGWSGYFVDSEVENGRTYRYRLILTPLYSLSQLQSPPTEVTPTSGATACLTLPPTAIADTSLTVKGVVLNPPGRTTSVSFEVGSTSAYGASHTASSTAVAGASEITYAVAPIPPDSEQHYRVVAQNADGTCRGSDRVARTWRSPEVLASGLQDPAALVLGADTIYFTERWANRVARIPKAGGTPETLVAGSSPAALAGDESVLYVADSNAIRRIDVQALSSTQLTVAFNSTEDQGLSLTGSHLYWRRISAGTTSANGIYGIPISGGTPVKVFTGTVSDFDARGGAVYCSVDDALWKVPSGPGAQPVALASLNVSASFVDVLATDDWLYYADWESGVGVGISRIPVAGGVPERLVRLPTVPGAGGALQLGAADATHLYFAEGPHVRRMPLGGGDVSTLAYDGAAYASVRAFAVDDTHVYWSHMNGITPGTGAILRAPKQ